MKVVVGLLAALSVLIACSGRQSSLGTAGHELMYPISQMEADRIVNIAMRKQFPGRDVFELEPPAFGYSTWLRFVSDRHDISLTAFPVRGRDNEKSIVDGYSFDVSHNGTMIILGPQAAEELFNRVQDMAKLKAKPLPIVAP
ncbi:MAG: hypothetical protein AB8B85_01480 [Paracoccaceae bacterium]